MHKVNSNDSYNGVQRIKRPTEGANQKQQRESTRNGQRSKEPTPRGMSPVMRSPQLSIRHTMSPVHLDTSQTGPLPSTPPPLPSQSPNVPASAAAPLPITGPTSALSAQQSHGRPPPLLAVPPGAGVAAAPGAQLAAAAAAQLVAAAKAKQHSHQSLTPAGNSHATHAVGPASGAYATGSPGTGAGASMGTSATASSSFPPASFPLQQVAYHPQSPPFPHQTPATQSSPGQRLKTEMSALPEGGISTTVSAPNLPGEVSKDSSAGGDGADVPEEPDPKVHEDRRGVRFCPPKLYFRDVFELDTRSQRFVLQNVRMRPVNVVVLEPASVLFSLDHGGFSGTLAPGMQYTDVLKMSLRQHGHIEGTIATFMTVLIDGQPENYEIEMLQAVPCLEVSPCELDFGVVDVSAPVRSLALRVRNTGRLMCAFAVDVNAGALPEAQLLAQELTVRPTKGKVYGRKEVRLRCELAPALEGDFDRQIWVRGPGVALPVPVRARVVKPRLELRHSSAVAGSLALLDFADCYFGTQRRRAAGVHSASADVCTFVVLVEQPGGLLMPLKLARERDPNLRVFQAHPQEGRIQSFETRIFTFGFDPIQWVDESEGRRPWHRKEFLIFLRVMRVECIDYDVIQDEKTTIETQPTTTTTEETTAGATRSWGAEGCEAAELRRRQKLSSWGSAVRLCLRAAAVPPAPRATPRTLHFGRVNKGAKVCRVLQVSNDSNTLAMGFRLHHPSPAGVRVRPETGELPPGASVELTVELTALALGPPTARRLTLDLLADSYPILGPRKRVVMGVLHVRIEHQCPMNAPPAAPRFTMGISPLITHEVGMVGDGVPFCTPHPLPHAAMQRFDLRGNYNYKLDEAKIAKYSGCYCVGMDKAGRRKPCPERDRHGTCLKHRRGEKHATHSPCGSTCESTTVPDSSRIPSPSRVTCSEEVPCDVTCCNEKEGQGSGDVEGRTTDTLNDAGTLSQLVEGPTSGRGSPTAPVAPAPAASPVPAPTASPATAHTTARRNLPSTCPRESGDSNTLPRRSGAGRRLRQRPAWPPPSLRRQAAAAAATAATVERLLVPIVPRLTCGVLMEPDEPPASSPMTGGTRDVAAAPGISGGGGGGGGVSGGGPSCGTQGLAGVDADRATGAAVGSPTTVSGARSPCDTDTDSPSSPITGCVLGNALDAVLRPQVVSDSSTDSEYTPADSSDSFETRWGAVTGAGQRPGAGSVDRHPCTACSRGGRPPSRRRRRRRQRSRGTSRRSGGGARPGAGAPPGGATGGGRGVRRRRRQRTTAAFVEHPQPSVEIKKKEQKPKIIGSKQNISVEAIVNTELKGENGGSKLQIPVQSNGQQKKESKMKLEMKKIIPEKESEKQGENDASLKETLFPEKKESLMIGSKKISIASLKTDKDQISLISGKKSSEKRIGVKKVSNASLRTDKDQISLISGKKSSGKPSLSGAPGETSTHSASWVTVSGPLTSSARMTKIRTKVSPVRAIRSRVLSTSPRSMSSRHHGKHKTKSGHSVLTPRGRALRASITSPGASSRLKALTRPPPPPPPPSLAPSTPQVPATPMTRQQSPRLSNERILCPPPPSPAHSPPLNCSPPPSPPPHPPPPEPEAEVVVAPQWRADIATYNTHVFVRSGPASSQAARVESSSLPVEPREDRTIGLSLPAVARMPPQPEPVAQVLPGSGGRAYGMSYPARGRMAQYFATSGPAVGREARPIVSSHPARSFMQVPAETKKPEPTGIGPPATTTLPPSLPLDPQQSINTIPRKGAQATTGTSNVTGTDDSEWAIDSSSGSSVDSGEHVWPSEGISLEPMETSAEATHRELASAFGPQAALPPCGASVLSDDLTTTMGGGGAGTGPGSLVRCSQLHWALGLVSHSHCPYIAFPNDMGQRSLRSWPANKPTRSIFTGAPRYAPPIDLENQLSPEDVLRRLVQADDARSLLRLLGSYSRCRRSVGKGLPPAEYAVSKPALYNLLDFVPSPVGEPTKAPQPNSPLTPLVTSTPMSVAADEEEVNALALVPLSPTQLFNVRLSPPQVDFGTVGVGSHVSSRVRVENANEVPVKVRIDSPNAALTVLDGTVYVPPKRAKIVFVFFEPFALGRYNGMIQYVVNDTHAFEAPVTAEVVLRSLALPAGPLSFGFVRGVEEAWPSIGHVVSVTNPLQVACRFEWSAFDKTCYDVVPRSGIVPPEGARACEITYRGNPDASSNDAELLLAGESDCYLPLICRYVPMPPPVLPKPPPVPPRIAGVRVPKRTSPNPSHPPLQPVLRNEPGLSTMSAAGKDYAGASKDADEAQAGQLRRLAAMNLAAVRGANFVRWRLLVPEVGVLRRRRITLLLFNSSFMETLFRVEDEPNYIGTNGVTSATTSGPDGVPRVSWGVWPRRGRLYPRSVRRLRLWVRPLLPGTFRVEIRVALGTNVFSPSSAVGPRPIPIEYARHSASQQTASTLPDSISSTVYEGRDTSPSAMQLMQHSPPPPPPPPPSSAMIQPNDVNQQYPVSPEGLEQAITNLLDNKATPGNRTGSPRTSTTRSRSSSERRQKRPNRRNNATTERPPMRARPTARSRRRRQQSVTSQSSARSFSRESRNGSRSRSRNTGGGSTTPKLRFINRAFDVQTAGGKQSVDNTGGSIATATVRAYATYPQVVVRPTEIRLRRVPAGSLVSVPIALCNTGVTDVPVRLAYGEAMLSGEWALSMCPHRLLPPPQPIMLPPRGPPTQIYLQFRPEDVASYEFLLPFQMSGGLGPPRIDQPGSHKADYFLCGARDRRAPRLPSVRVDATVSRRLLQISDNLFRFQYDPSDKRHQGVERRIIKVENVHVTTLMIWFPLDPLEGTPFHLEPVQAGRGPFINAPFEAPEVALRAVQMMRPRLSLDGSDMDRNRGDSIGASWGDKRYDVEPTVAAIEAASIATRIVMAMADTAVNVAEKEGDRSSNVSPSAEAGSRQTRFTSSIDSPETFSAGGSLSMDMSMALEDLQQEALEHVMGLFRIADEISASSKGDSKKETRQPEGGRALCCVLASGGSCGFTLTYTPERVPSPPARSSRSPSRTKDSRTPSPDYSPQSPPTSSPTRDSRSPSSASPRKSSRRQSAKRQSAKRLSPRRSSRNTSRKKHRQTTHQEEREVEWTGWPLPSILALPLHVGYPGAGEGAERALLHVLAHGEVLTPKLIPSDREIYLPPRPLNVASERLITLTASHLEADAIVNWKFKFSHQRSANPIPKDPPVNVAMFDREVSSGPRKQNFKVLLSYKVQRPLGVKLAIHFYTTPVNGSDRTRGVSGGGDGADGKNRDWSAPIPGQARCVVIVWAASDNSLLTTHPYLRAHHQQYEPLPPPTGPLPPSPLGWARNTRIQRPQHYDTSDNEEPPEDEDMSMYDELMDWNESLLSEIAMRAAARGVPLKASPGWTSSRKKQSTVVGRKTAGDKDANILSPSIFSMEDVSLKVTLHSGTMVSSPSESSQRRVPLVPRATQLSDADPMYKTPFSPSPSRKASQRSAAVSNQSLSSLQTTTDRRSEKAVPAGQSLLEPRTSTGTNRILSPPPRRHRTGSRCDPEEASVDADQDSLLTSESSGTEEEVTIQSETTSRAQTSSQGRTSDDGISYPAFPSSTDFTKTAHHMRRVQKAVEEWMYDIVFRREYWVSIPFGFNEIWRSGTPRLNRRSSQTGEVAGIRTSLSTDPKAQYEEFKERAARRMSGRDKSGGTWLAVEAAAGRHTISKRLSDPRRYSRVSDPARVAQSGSRGPSLIPTCPFHMGTPFQGIYNLIGSPFCAVVDERIPSPYPAFSAEWWCEQAMGAVGCMEDVDGEDAWLTGAEGVGGGDALSEAAVLRLSRLSLHLYEALLYVLRANGAVLPHVKAENMLDYKRYEALKREEVNRIRTKVAARTNAYLVSTRGAEPPRWAGPGGSSVAITPPGSPMQTVMEAAIGNMSTSHHTSRPITVHPQRPLRASRPQQRSSNLTSAQTSARAERSDSAAVASAAITLAADSAVAKAILNEAQSAGRQKGVSPRTISPVSPTRDTRTAMHPGVGLADTIVKRAVETALEPHYLRPDEDPPKVTPEALHVRLQRQAWLDVCLQLARVFWLPKVDDEEIHAAEERARAEARQPSWDESSQNPDVRWRQYRVASSNNYSPPELTLLGWLNDCYERERHTMFIHMDVQLPQRTVANFDSDLADCLVLAAVTLHTCPFIAPMLNDLYPEPVNTEQVSHNGARLVGCWKKLRIGFTVSLRDMVNPLAVKMLLLTAHLHAVLPTLSAPRTLMLQAPLATTARASLALVNPSPLKMQYLVEFIGDMDGFFSVIAPGLLTGHSAPKVKGGGKGVAFPLGPGQRLNLIVRFHARTLTPKNSMLLLTGLVQAPNFGRSIALRLEGSASALDVSSSLKISLPLFRPMTRELRVPLPYDAPPPPPRAPKPIKTGSPSALVRTQEFSTSPLTQVNQILDTDSNASDLAIDNLPEFELFLASVQPTTGQEFAGNAWETLRSLKMLRRCFLNQSRVKALPLLTQPKPGRGGTLAPGVAPGLASSPPGKEPDAAAAAAAAAAGSQATGAAASGLGRAGTLSVGAVNSSVLQGLGPGGSGAPQDTAPPTRRTTYRTSSTNLDAQSHTTVSSAASFTSRWRSIPAEDFAAMSGKPKQSMRAIASKHQQVPRGRMGTQRKETPQEKTVVDDTLAFEPRDPTGGVRNWALLNVTLCAFTPKVRHHWIACVSPSAGDFIIKLVTKPTLGPPLATLHLRLPPDHTTATCSCGLRPAPESGPCPLRTVLEIPQRNDPMWRAVAFMFDKTLDDVERLFWQQHLDSSIALQLMQWMLKNEEGDLVDEYAHVFNNRVTYKLTLTGDYTIRPCNPQFVIDDVRSDGTIPLNMHVQPATQEGHEFRLRLTSVDGREVRLYKVRVSPALKAPPESESTLSAPPSSEGEPEMARGAAGSPDKPDAAASGPKKKKAEKKLKALQEAAKEKAAVEQGVATGRVVAAAVVAEASKRWGAGRGGATPQDVSPLADIKRALDNKGQYIGTGGGRAVLLPPRKLSARPAEGASDARRDSGEGRGPRRRRSSGGVASPGDDASPVPRPSAEEDKELVVRRFPLSFSPISGPPPAPPKRSNLWKK